MKYVVFIRVVITTYIDNFSTIYFNLKFFLTKFEKSSEFFLRQLDLFLSDNTSVFCSSLFILIIHPFSVLLFFNLIMHLFSVTLFFYLIKNLFSVLLFLIWSYICFLFFSFIWSYICFLFLYFLSDHASVSCSSLFIWSYICFMFFSFFSNHSSVFCSSLLDLRILVSCRKFWGYSLCQNSALIMTNRISKVRLGVDIYDKKSWFL